MIAALLMLAAHANAADQIRNDTGAKSGAEIDQESVENDNAEALLSIKKELQRLRSAVEAARTNPYAEAEQRHAQADLEAQQAMALWAMWMFFAATVSVLITGVGVFLIFRTLGYTRDAAKEAKRAADAGWETVNEANKATAAAEDTLLETKENAQRQLRAYIFPHGPKIDVFQPGRQIQGEMIFKNSGATPAYDVRTMLQTFLIQLPLQRPFPGYDIPKEQARSAVGSGGKISIPFMAPTPLSQEEFDAVAAGKYAFFVFGEVSYVDLFKKERFTKYRLYFGQESLRQGTGMLRVCHEGNEAN